MGFEDGGEDGFVHREERPGELAGEGPRRGRERYGEFELVVEACRLGSFLHRSPCRLSARRSSSEGKGEMSYEQRVQSKCGEEWTVRRCVT